MAELEKQSPENSQKMRRRALKFNDLGVMLHTAGHKKEALLAFKKALLNDPDNYIPYFNIGNMMRDLNQLDRAIYFYEKAIVLNPDDMDVYFNVAPLYRYTHNEAKAIKTYQAILAMDADNSVARHFLLALQGETPSQAPLPYVEQLFDNYADNFEVHLTKNLAYQTPKRLADLMLLPSAGSVRFERGIDMGCGTGLMGDLIKAHCTHLTGIDVSRKMLDQATAKGIYDTIIKSNIIDYLTTAGKFDLFIAADVLPYFGDLDPLFALIKEHGTHGAAFVFSTESAVLDGYHLATTGRFQHGPSYIEKLADKYGFKMTAAEQRPIRVQDGIEIHGGLFVLTKNN